MVFIINGYLGSGKDTFVDMVSKIYSELKPLSKVVNISSIDYLKDIFKREFDWDGKKTPEVRAALATTHIALSRWNDIPFVLTSEKIKMEHSKGNIVFVHCREPENIIKYTMAFQAPTIFVDNEQAKNAALLNAKNLTSSDLDIENYKYTIHINNNSTFEKLEEEAKNFVYDWIIGY